MFQPETPLIDYGGCSDSRYIYQRLSPIPGFNFLHIMNGTYPAPPPAYALIEQFKEHGKYRSVLADATKYSLVYIRKRWEEFANQDRTQSSFLLT